VDGAFRGVFAAQGDVVEASQRTPEAEEAMSVESEALDDGAVETLACAWPPCARSFIVRKHWQKYCSNKCRMAHANYLRKLGMEQVREWVAQGVPLPLPPGASAVASSTAW
jgi:hypothetical protein